MNNISLQKKIKNSGKIITVYALGNVGGPIAAPFEEYIEKLFLIDN